MIRANKNVNSRIDADNFVDRLLSGAESAVTSIDGIFRFATKETTSRGTFHFLLKQKNLHDSLSLVLIEVKAVDEITIAAEGRRSVMNFICFVD
jgi:hypothetical protein